MVKGPKIPKGKHPIQVVSRRTGLRPDVLRVWERRYGAVVPERTSTNRRYYSDSDVEKLLLLKELTGLGRRIGQVAGLELEELRELAAEDAAALAAAPSSGRAPVAASGEHLTACREAIRSLDASSLRSNLERAALDLPPPLLLESLLIPLLQEIGHAWETGELRIAHEHTASAVIRVFLANLENAYGSSDPGPAVVLATPPGQVHEMGALVAAATAASEGWQPVYLGADLPVEEIAAAARQVEARVVALSLVYPEIDFGLLEQLKKLKRLLPEETVLILGGRAASSFTGSLDSRIAARVDNMLELRAELRRLRGLPSQQAAC